MNRPLLHAEELEGRIIADGPTCTCRSNNVCPMCGSAEADAGCAVHDGHDLAMLLKEASEREPTDEELDARLKELDLDALLDGQEPNEVLDHVRAHDKNCVLDWIEAEVNGGKTHLRTDEILGKLRACDILKYLAKEEKEAFREWINENVEAEMTTDDLGQKVPTLNITGL